MYVVELDATTGRMALVGLKSQSKNSMRFVARIRYPLYASMDGDQGRSYAGLWLFSPSARSFETDLGIPLAFPRGGILEQARVGALHGDQAYCHHHDFHNLKL